MKKNKSKTGILLVGFLTLCFCWALVSNYFLYMLTGVLKLSTVATLIGVVVASLSVFLVARGASVINSKAPNEEMVSKIRIMKPIHYNEKTVYKLSRPNSSIDYLMYEKRREYFK
jgi:hypothetical protein